MYNAMAVFPFHQSEEPSQEVGFIAGYESNGREWEGTFYYQYDMFFVDGFELGKNNNVLIAMSPTGGTYGADANIETFLYYFLEYDMMWVMPAGSNAYHALVYNHTVPFKNQYITGAGDIENLTGTKIETYQEDVVNAVPIRITSIMRENTTWAIDKIMRVTNKVLSIKLVGIPNVIELGFTGFGMPVTLSGVTGTNILPLPNGTYATGNSLAFPSPEGLIIGHNTTAGTLGVYQAVTGGTVRFGSTNPGIIYVVLSSYRFMLNGWACQIENVNGFTSNPNGTFPVTEAIQDGYGDKFRITYNVVGGAFDDTLSPSFTNHTSSNSTPYIAGILLSLREQLAERDGSCSWDKARDCLNLGTQEAEGVPYSVTNGYGKALIENGLNYAGALPAERTYPLGTIGTVGAFFTSTPGMLASTLTVVPNATRYHVYRDNALYQTIEYNKINVNFVEIEDRLYFKSETRLQWKYQCSQRGIYTAFSATRKMKNRFKYRNARFKVGASPL